MDEDEKQCLNKLFELMRENPDLPVAPMVYYEETNGKFDCRFGLWKGVEIDEYLIIGGSMYTKGPDDECMVLTLGKFLEYEELLSDEELLDLLGDKEKCKSVYEALPWTKAIIVEIELRY